MSSSPADRSSLTGWDDQLVLVVAGLAALGAALAPGSATGLVVVDGIYRAAVGGATVLLAARARRWTWLVLAGVAAATARGGALVPAWAALGLVVVTSARRVRLRLVGSLAAAIAVQVLLRQDGYGFQGLPLLVGAAAILPAAVSGHRRCQSWTRRRVRRALLGVGAVAGVSAALAVVAIALAAGPLRAGAGGAEAALDRARSGETDGAGADLGRASAQLEEASSLLDAPWAMPARLLPGVSQQISALSVVADSGAAVGRSGEALAEVGGYQDLRFRSGAIDLARVEALRVPLSAAAVVLDERSDRLAAIERDWLVAPLGAGIDEAEVDLRDAASDTDLAADVVELLPGLLGGDGSRRYLVAFLNPAEERGLGGFVGNYGELVASDGEVRLAGSGSSVEIEQATPPGGRTLDGPEEYLAVHGRANSADLLRDASSSPHFPHSASVMTQIVEQTRGEHVDGVIAMDARAVAALLELTGPIRVPGRSAPLTSENVVDVIVRQQYLDYAAANTERKDLLEAATEEAFDQLLTGDLPSPERLVDVLGPMVRERHLLLHAERQPEQRLFERIGADGAITDETGGETLMVAHQNFGNSKIDAYLRRTIAYDTVIDAADGSITATATVSLTNVAPAAGLPDYVIGNSRGEPSGTNLMNLLVYSQLDPVAVRVDGEGRPFGVGQEAGSQVASLAVAIPPGGTVEVVVDLEGRDDLAARPYGVRVLPQPMVNADRLSLSLAVEHGSATPVGPDELARHGAVLVRSEEALGEPVEVAVELTGER